MSRVMGGRNDSGAGPTSVMPLAITLSQTIGLPSEPPRFKAPNW